MKRQRQSLVILSCILLFLQAEAYSQLGNKNMYLLANVNSHVTPYSAIWGYVAPNGREYAILGCYDGTAFIDITNQSNVRQVGFVPSTNSSSSNNQWREMKTYSHYAYIVSEVPNSGIQIVDLQYLPDSVRYIKKFVPAGHTSTHSISQSGPYLYLNGCNSTYGQGVNVFDLSADPENPVFKGGYNVEYIHDSRIVNDTIYAANILQGKVSIINAKNKSSLNLVTQFTNLPNSGPHNTALTADGKYLLVTDEIGGTPRLMKFWDIRDKSNITYVTNWQPTGITTSIVHNVEVYGNFAVVGHYTAGVRMIDISNPASPTEVAWYDTYSQNNISSYNGCWGVYMFPSGKIAASDRQTGLYLLKTYYNVNVAIEGYYDNVNNRLRARDTITAYLKNTYSPFNTIDSSKEVVDSLTLTCNFKFNKAANGNYYIVLKHRNSIQTWSRVGGENYNAMAFQTYDFTNSKSKAFGSNLTQVDNSPAVFAMYSGDVNQDGIIDGSDVSKISNDASNFVMGYVASNLNGDVFVDGTDLAIATNNTYNFTAVIKP